MKLKHTQISIAACRTYLQAVYVVPAPGHIPVVVLAAIVCFSIAPAGAGVACTTIGCCSAAQEGPAE